MISPYGNKQLLPKRKGILALVQYKALLQKEAMEESSEDGSKTKSNTTRVGTSGLLPKVQ